MLDEIQPVRKSKPAEIEEINPVKNKILSTLGKVFVVAITLVAIYSSYQLYMLKKPDYQQKMLQKQTADIVNSVSKIFQLPEGTPQIATVNDVASLKKSQPFFNLAQNGDTVLVYSNEIILYRASQNKVINVAPVTSNPVTPAPTVQNTTPDTKAPVKK